MTIVQTAAEGLTPDELASVSGVSLRTIRFYQSEGLLPAPVRHGRAVRYGDEHLRRLRFIAAMRERGLSLAAIAELAAAEAEDATDGQALAGWLGLRDVLVQPWSDDRALVLAEAELDERLRDLPAGTRDRLVAGGLLERRTDTTPIAYFVPSAGLLDVSLAALRLGIDVDTGARLLALVRSRLAGVADELVARFTEEVSVGRLTSGGPDSLGQLLAELQPLTRTLVDLVFAHEMQRAQRQLVAAAEAEVIPETDPEKEG